MPDFRRLFVPGGSYFFTVNLLERRGNRLLADNMDALRKAVCKTKLERPFRINAGVVLPKHMHMMLKLPAGDANFSSLGGHPVPTRHSACNLKPVGNKLLTLRFGHEPISTLPSHL